MIRVGIIGTGAIATSHIAALKQVSRATITALVDPVIARAEQAAAATGGKPFAAADQMWDDVDAVWICTPHHLHAEVCLAAARAGKHVFSEKPIAHTLEAATSMVTACREAGVKLMVGQVLRFWPALRAMRVLVRQGKLGDLTGVFSRRLSPGGGEDLVWWRQDWRVGGGFTIGNGSHELDFVRWVGEAAGGRAARVTGRVSFADPAHPNLDTYVRATVGFSNGVTGGFDGGYGFALGGPQTRTVFGTRGMAVAEGQGLRVRLNGAKEDQPLDLGRLTGLAMHGEAGPAAFLAEDEEFLNAIIEDRDPAVTGEDSLASLALCLAVHRSSQSGGELVGL